MTLFQNLVQELRRASAMPADAPVNLTTAVQVGIVTLLAWGAGLIPAVTHLRFAYPIAAVEAVVLVALLPRLGGPLVYACALIFATVIGESNLVAAAGRNMPALVLALPVLVAALVEAWDHRRPLVGPPLSIWIAAVVYLACAALSVAGTTLQGVRILYPLNQLAIMTIGLLLGLVAIPSIAWSPARRRLLVLSIALLGPLLVATSVLFILLKDVPWAGNYLGAWIYTEVTLFKEHTGIVFPRATGPFQQPFGAAGVLTFSMLALLALRPTFTTRGRILANLTIVVDGIALFVTWNRDGWLMVFVAVALLAAFEIVRQRRIDLWSVGVAAAFLVLLVGLSLNWVGADIRQDVAQQVYGTEGANRAFQNQVDVGSAIRGGTGLSGRDYLWTASVDAFKKKPVIGYGMGHDQEAISPYLTGNGTHLRGFTSDSIWLVTAVERGLLGLLGLLVFCVVAVFAIVRKFLLAPLGEIDRIAVMAGATFIALLAGATFETFLLGGLTFPSVQLALMAGLALGIRRLDVERLPAAEPSAQAA